MNRIRKACLGLVTLLALLAPSALPETAHANPTHVRTVSYRAYYVYARSCPHDSWHCLGGTYDYNQALQYANYVRSMGYESFVR